MVVNPEVSSVRDADRIIGLLEAQQITEIRLVVNRLRPKMVASGNMLSIDDMVDILGGQAHRHRSRGRGHHRFDQRG